MQSDPAASQYLYRHRHDEYYSEGLTVLKMSGISTEDQAIIILYPNF